MKNRIHLALIVMAIGWSCAEKSTISEVASTPSPVLSSYIVNGNSKATLAWEIPSSNPPQQFAIYRDTIALFSWSTASRIRTLSSYPTGGVVDSPLTNKKYYYYTVVSENIGTLGTIVQSLPSNTAQAFPFDYSSVDTAKIIYSQHIQQIFNSGCAVHGCHVGVTMESHDPATLRKSRTSESTSGQFSLRSWADAVRGDGGISVVVPFKSTKSDLIHHVNRDTILAPASQPSMPRVDVAMPRDQVNLLMSWIDHGAKNDDGEVPYSSIPARGRAYITNQGEDLVAVVDMDANIVTRFITAGVANTQLQPPMAPHNVVVDLQNEFYYVNLIGGDRLLKFRVSDNAKVGELSTGIKSPAQVALSAGGDTAYVTDFLDGSNGIHVVNTRTMSVLSSVGDARMNKPHGATVTHDFKYVLISNQLSDNITVIQTSDNSIVDVVRLSGSVPVFPNAAPKFQPYQSVVTLDSKFAFVTCSVSNEVRVIDLNSLKVVDSIKVGQRPLILDMTPDGNYIYVANRNSNSVSVIRTSDHSVVTTIMNVGVDPHGVGISRDGKYAYVSCENLDGSDEPHHPTVGGKKIGTVAIIDIATNTVIRELEVGNFAAGVAVMH